MSANYQLLLWVLLTLLKDGNVLLNFKGFGFVKGAISLKGLTWTYRIIALNGKLISLQNKKNTKPANEKKVLNLASLKYFAFCLVSSSGVRGDSIIYVYNTVFHGISILLRKEWIASCLSELSCEYNLCFLLLKHRPPLRYIYDLVIFILQERNYLSEIYCLSSFINIIPVLSRVQNGIFNVAYPRHFSWCCLMEIQIWFY